MKELIYISFSVLSLAIADHFHARAWPNTVFIFLTWAAMWIAGLSVFLNLFILIGKIGGFIPK